MRRGVRPGIRRFKVSIFADEEFEADSEWEAEEMAKEKWEREGRYRVYEIEEK